LNPEESNIVEVQWKDLMVGDVVFVKKDQFFPADLLLLGSSDEKGFAFVETRNLDGESNLKTKDMPDLLIDNMRLVNKEKRGNIKMDHRKSKISKTLSLSFDNVN
jgi:P-type E1-E2 ATPase